MFRLLFLVFVLTNSNSWSQQIAVCEATEEDFLSADYTMKPHYKEGVSALKSVISKNFIYDQTDSCHLSQKYNCELTISKTGSVIRVELSTYQALPVCEKCMKQLEKVLLKINWIPAHLEGMKIPDTVSFPVSIHTK